MLFHTHRQQRQISRFVPIYLANLFLTLHWAIFLYIDSSFLERYFTKNQVGLLYIFGASLSLLLLLKTKPLLRHMRTFTLLMISTVIEFAVIGVIALSHSPLFIALAFILHFGVIFEMILCLDLFLEGISKDNWTGAVRTEFLTIMSAMVMIGPLIAGRLVSWGGYSLVYIIALVVLVPFFFLIWFGFRSARAHVAHPRHFPASAFATFVENSALRNIYLSRLVLSFFFSWMVIYMPIYLHKFVGHEWSDIGVVFTVMLLPFVLFQIPAGQLADKWFGEKEILTLGFIIMGIFTACIPFIPFDASLVIWTVVLFMTRVGASLVEAMTESYFYKHVDVTNENLIGFFRTTDPLSYIIGPLLATIAFVFLPSFGSAFLILGIICILGIFYSLPLKDTK